jgi:hypothetical protein
MRIAGRICRPPVLAAIFGSYFAIVMFESWTFSSKLASPWYGPDLSRWIYMSFVVASAVFIMGVGMLAFQIENAFENRVREINRQLGALLWDAGTAFPLVEGLPPPSDEDAEENVDPTERELDEMLEVLGDAQAQVAQEVLVGSSAGTVEEVDPVEAAQDAMLQQNLLRRREGLKRHEDFLMRFLPGPMGVAVGVLGISMVMLPATDVMLQTFHGLNTALILGFSYAWIGLAAYFGASVLGLAASLRTERKRRRKERRRRIRKDDE